MTELQRDCSGDLTGAVGRVRSDRLERERLRALIARNLVECCDECRALLRNQLEREEQRADRSLERTPDMSTRDRT